MNPRCVGELNPLGARPSIECVYNGIAHAQCAACWAAARRSCLGFEIPTWQRQRSVFPSFPFTKTWNDFRSPAPALRPSRVSSPSPPDRCRSDLRCSPVTPAGKSPPSRIPPSRYRRIPNAGWTARVGASISSILWSCRPMLSVPSEKCIGSGSHRTGALGKRRGATREREVEYVRARSSVRHTDPDLTSEIR